ncbi:MAG TPA: hypothetical protein VN777_16305 [Terriglobales bacterium]|nr:hypothetical protein [Terriglobales bacterium]
MKLLVVLCVFCGLVVPGTALDREAFTFTKYDLNVRIEPEQQRLGVRGKITLRNDSTAFQKNVALQISSTLNWRSIQIGGEAVEFVTHEYTSDIDHTGALSEAIVTLPREVPPKGTIEVDVGYEGVIPLDATRLTRIGVPEDKAKHTDWDQISKSFTAVRGVGYVAWYPVATEAANLSDGNSVAETVGRWKARFASGTMSLIFESTIDAPIFFTGTPDAGLVSKQPGIVKVGVFSAANLGVSVPTFVIANYQKLAPNDLLTIQYLPGQENGAKEYAEVAANIDIPIPPLGGGSGSLEILGLPDPDAASFVSEGMLLCPLKSPIANDGVLDIVYAKARHAVLSPRAWIQEGLAHYTQAAFIADDDGRQAALDYLNTHRAPLVEAEKAKPAADRETAHSLINAPDDLYLQTKAMDIWWMLKDMLGDALSGALLSYHSSEDKDGNYMQRMIEKETHRDLQWFFDDWVYRDRGLPDFRVDSVYPRPIVDGGYMITVTIENLGDAGAEVPVILRMESGEITKRLEVRAKSKAAVRVQTASIPLEVVVNDGSVPESDISNNVFKVPQADAAK